MTANTEKNHVKYQIWYLSEIYIYPEKKIVNQWEILF